MTNAFQQEIWQELERAAHENARRAMLHAIGYEEMTYQREQRRRPPSSSSSPPPPLRFDEKVQNWLSSVVMPLINWVVKSCLFLLFLLILSIGIYSIVWGTIMKGLDVKSHKVYFDYSPGGGANNNGMPIPTAIVDLRSMKNSPWSHSCGEELYAPTASPSSEQHECLSRDRETISNRVEDEYTDKEVKTSILAPSQRYFFELVLSLPESDINKKLGVFMVKVELQSADGSLLASSKQHSMLPYESSMVTLFRKMALILPLAFGFMAETRIVTLLCFDHYTDRSHKRPVTFVEVTLGVPNPASFPKTLQTIQIHSAELRYGKEMNAIQACLRHWKYSCATIVISALFFGFLSIAISILSRRAQRRRWNEEPYADFFDSDGDESADLMNASSQNRWMGADIEILDDSENDSNAWEPILPKENTAKSKPHLENVSVSDNFVSDDESTSVRDRQLEEQNGDKLSSGELGSNSTPIPEEPLIATTPSDNEMRNREMLDEHSLLQKKEEEKLSEMVMKDAHQS